MNFCPNCGAPGVVRRVPEGDTHPRAVCEACGAVHYENPKVIAGCVTGVDDRVLLVRRAEEPRCGTWTLPAGFMENGETLEQAAARETREEAGASVSIDCLYSVFSIPRIDQVYVIFHGRMMASTLKTGPESLEVRLFRPQEIPWENISYKAISQVIERYVREMSSRSFSLYVGSYEEGKVFFAGGQTPAGNVS